MSERLVDAATIWEDTIYVRRERLNGDPDRGPDETTLEDVIEVMLRQGKHRTEIARHQRRHTRAVRLMIRGLVDQQR